MEIPASIIAVPWKIAGLLRISGTDAEIFLQGQFTNDLRTLPAGRGIYGLWLNQKGKIIADSFILHGTNEKDFFVVSYFSTAAEIRRRLEDYIIADDVMIEDLTAQWSGISFVGAGAGDWLRGEKRPGAFFSGRRTREENWEWIFPRSDMEHVTAAVVGTTNVEAETLARMRMEALIPAVPFDLGLGDLPAEGGLEIEAISYTKGCYLGQEVMARLKSMGQVRRRLMRVRGRGPQPVVPQKLKQGEKIVGELRSVVADGDGFLGLAMMSLVNLRKDASVSLENDASLELTLDFRISSS